MRKDLQRSFAETLAAITIEVSHESNYYAFLYQRLAGGYAAVIDHLITLATSFEETYTDELWDDNDWYDAIDAWTIASLEELGYSKLETYTVHPVKSTDIKVSISLEKFREDLITNAVEAGSGYWYYFSPEVWKIIAKHCPKEKKRSPFSTRIWEAIKAGATIPINDQEDNESKIGSISLESIAKGEQILADKYASHLADILNENDDAITADVWFQLCSLGEIVYG